MTCNDLRQKSQVPTPHGVRALGDVGDAGLRGLLGARPAGDTTSRPTHLSGEALRSMKFTKFTVHFTQRCFIIYHKCQIIWLQNLSLHFLARHRNKGAFEFSHSEPNGFGIICRTLPTGLANAAFTGKICVRHGTRKTRKTRDMISSLFISSAHSFFHPLPFLPFSSPSPVTIFADSFTSRIPKAFIEQWFYESLGTVTFYPRMERPSLPGLLDLPGWTAGRSKNTHVETTWNFTKGRAWAERSGFSLFVLLSIFVAGWWCEGDWFFWMHGTQNCNESGERGRPWLSANATHLPVQLWLQGARVTVLASNSAKAITHGLRYRSRPCVPASLPLLLVAFTSALKVCSVMHICLNKSTVHMPVARSCDLFSNGNMEFCGIMVDQHSGLKLPSILTFSDLAWSVQRR